MEVHVCTQAQSDANVQPVWLPQVGGHGVVSGEIWEHDTFIKSEIFMTAVDQKLYRIVA